MSGSAALVEPSLPYPAGEPVEYGDFASMWRVGGQPPSHTLASPAGAGEAVVFNIQHNVVQHNQVQNVDSVRALEYAAERDRLAQNYLTGIELEARSAVTGARRETKLGRR